MTMLSKKKFLEVLAIIADMFPEAHGELDAETPFQLLIAVILSAQATDKGVNKATPALFAKYPDSQSLAQADVSDVENLIKTIGLYRSKARHIMQTCQILIDRYNGDVPHSREALQALPGVGRKTANVVLNTAFGQHTMAVDTHIFRLGNRTGLAVGKNVLEVEQRLIKVIPKEFLIDSHHWLILHGRYCCIARKPKCGECVVSDVCNWPDRFEFGAHRHIKLHEIHHDSIPK